MESCLSSVLSRISAVWESGRNLVWCGAEEEIREIPPVTITASPSSGRGVTSPLMGDMQEPFPGKTKLFIGSSDEEDNVEEEDPLGHGSQTQTRLLFDTDDESPSRQPAMNLRRRLARDELAAGHQGQTSSLSRTRNLAKAFDDI
jgi:hypothetical protein